MCEVSVINMESRISKMIKYKTYFFIIFIVFMVACSETNPESELAEIVDSSVITESPVSKPKLFKNTDSTFNKIYNAYTNCKDYDWFNKINFSLRKALRKILKVGNERSTEALALYSIFHSSLSLGGIFINRELSLIAK